MGGKQEKKSPSSQGTKKKKKEINSRSIVISAVRECKTRKGDGKHHDLWVTMQQRRWGTIFDSMVREVSSR